MMFTILYKSLLRFPIASAGTVRRPQMTYKKYMLILTNNPSMVYGKTLLMHALFGTNMGGNRYYPTALWFYISHFWKCAKLLLADKALFGKEKDGRFRLENSRKTKPAVALRPSSFNPAHLRHKRCAAPSC
jgi:hypothetical protein